MVVESRRGLMLWLLALTTPVLLLTTGCTPSVPAAVRHATAVVVFIDFSGSISGDDRTSYKREIESEILPSLSAGDGLMIAQLNDKTLTEDPRRPGRQGLHPQAPGRVRLRVGGVREVGRARGEHRPVLAGVLPTGRGRHGFEPVCPRPPSLAPGQFLPPDQHGARLLRLGHPASGRNRIGHRGGIRVSAGPPRRSR